MKLKFQSTLYHKKNYFFCDKLNGIILELGIKQKFESQTYDTELYLICFDSQKFKLGADLIKSLT